MSPGAAGSTGSPRVVAGVDGCRGGWVVALLAAPAGDPRCGARVRLARCPDFAAVAARCCGVALALVDVPMGLPERPEDGDRPCDREARRLLGRPRAASVFRVPSRAALYGPSPPPGLTRQAAALIPRLRDVDAVLRRRPALQRRLREGHPELCLWALAGGRAMAHPKRTAAGREERRALLAGWLPGCAPLRDDATLRATARALGAAPDDVLDALALAVAAARVAAGDALVLGGQRDAAGLRMEIVTCRPHIAGGAAGPPA